MKKRVISLLLMCGLFLTALGGNAFASSSSDICGYGVRWSFDPDTGVLTIRSDGTGDGKMFDFTIMYDNIFGHYSNFAPWWGSRHEIKEIVVEEGVTYIGAHAFAGNPRINKDSNCAAAVLKIADSVTAIGIRAFQYCSLRDVTLGSGLTSIGDLAFADNYDLAHVDLPEGLTTIGTWAFVATGMTEVRIPAGVTSIGDEAFGCNTRIDDDDVVSAGFTIIGNEGTEAENYYKTLLAQFNEEKAQNAQLYPDFYPADGTVHFKSLKPAVNVTVGGAAVGWTDAVPFIDGNSRTMVPLRAVAEALGLTVSWDGANREAVFTDGTKTIYFPIGSSTARTGDGGTVQMDTAAVIVNDRTFAPIRYLAEFFGFTVDWDGAAKTVLIMQG